MESQLPRLVIAGLVGCLAVACGLSDDGPTSPNPGDVPREPVVFAADSLAAAESITTESGLTVIHLEVGAGRQPGPGNHVFVHYTGMLVDGTVFDDSYTRGVPFDFALGQGRVIAGWDEGIALMKEGGRARLVIPPALAYGEAGPIPMHISIRQRRFPVSLPRPSGARTPCQRRLQTGSTRSSTSSSWTGGTRTGSTRR